MPRKALRTMYQMGPAAAVTLRHLPEGDRMLPITLGRQALRRRSLRHRHRQTPRKIRPSGYQRGHQPTARTSSRLTG